MYLETLFIRNSLLKLIHKDNKSPERARAKEIREMISKSELFWLFLTENVTKSIFTQNWVSFELGCVYAQKKENTKSIFIIEPFKQINFPIPYLDYYILYDPDSLAHWDFVENLFTNEVKYKREKNYYYLFMMMISLYFRLKGENPSLRPSDRWGHKISHKCGVKYKMISEIEKWYCPYCRTETNWMPSQIDSK